MNPRNNQRRESHVLHRDLLHPPTRIARGEGAYVWDADGTRYLDASSAANVVMAIGYGVPEVVEAMRTQAEEIPFCGAFTSSAQEELAELIARHSPEELSWVKFASGGSEAVETAIKLARHYFLERGLPRKWKVIGRWKSYHGNTLGALAASGHTRRRSEYTPYLSDFPHISPAYSLADAEELEAMIVNVGADDVAAFIAEPVVGAADFGRMAPAGYYERIREICNKYDLLFIADEVMTGFGRTGRFWGIDHWDATPDIIAFAKGASSGYAPFGGIVASGAIVDAIRQGSGIFDHGHTYSGNPLSCAVALAVVKYIDDHQLVSNADKVGNYLRERLESRLSTLQIVGEISGAGMMQGIELVADRQGTAFDPAFRVSARIGEAARRRGVLINPGFGGQSVDGDPERIGVCPPLIFTPEQVDITVDVLVDSIREVSQTLPGE